MANGETDSERRQRFIRMAVRAQDREIEADARKRAALLDLQEMHHAEDLDYGDLFAAIALVLQTQGLAE